jgi:two-component system, OmpR family, KDP operon response regulator KdpE
VVVGEGDIRRGLRDGRGTVLVVDDERSYRVLLDMNLRRAGYRVVQAATGEEGLSALEQESPDLVILDLRLPDMEGEEICRRIRIHPSFRDLPVVMLTARADQINKIRGLQLGADDYVTKPFDVDELVARIGAVLRRARRRGGAPVGAVMPVAPPQPYAHGDLEIDVVRPRVAVKGVDVTCTPTEYRLLAVLVENAGKVLVQDELLRRVWGPGYEGEGALLHTAMWRLRRKLGDDPRRPRHLLSLRGVGYSLAAPVASDERHPFETGAGTPDSPATL